MKKIIFAALIICEFAFASVQIITSSPYGFDGILTAENPIVINSPHPGFTDIIIPNGSLDGDFGGPFLPSYRFLIELPAYGDASVRISSYSSVEIPITSPPSPLQPPRPKSRPQPSFSYNQDLYDNHKSSPIAEIIPMGIMRGRNLGILILRPLGYDSKRNILEFRKNIEFHIDYDKHLDPVSPRMASGWADMLLSSTLLAPMDIPRVFDYPSEYLIITDNEFASHLNEFIQFKEQQGYKVTVASVDTIGADTLSIKAFVQDAYDSWDIPPDFLLIVGDVDRVPTLRRGTGWTNYPTDQYYVMVEGADYFPDIACGRMSVESLPELNAILDKTMAYGRFDFSETSWLRRFVLPACGTDGDYELCMGTHRYCAEEHLPPSDFDVDTIFAYFGGTGADLIASINTGAAVVDYSGHGLETEWSNPNVDVSDLPGLTNNGKFGLVISNACLTNTFNYTSPCLGETWIRQTNKAAVAHIAGSASTYWDEDDWWQRSVFDAVFDYGYHAAASFMYRGCMEVELRGSTAGDYYFHIYHILGDPSMGFYWGEPEPIVADFPAIIPIGLTTLNLDVPESTIVSVWSPSGTRGSAYSIGGTASILMDPPPVAGDTLNIYCYKANFFEPIWEKIPVAPLVAYTIDPESLVVSTPGTISIYMGDTLGTPVVGATIVIDGIAMAETLTTDATGNASYSFTPSYAEILQITGYNPLGELAFVEYITVGGGTTLIPALIDAASPIVHIWDSLAVGVQGQIGFESTEYPVLWCLSGLGLDTCGTSIDSVVIEITPEITGNYVLMTVAEGYAVGNSSVRAALCEGIFDGELTDGSGTPVSDVRIALYPAGADTSITERTALLISDSAGDFESDDEIQLGYYDLYLTGFGWEDTVITNHIHHADGGYDFEINRANFGSISIGAADDFGSPIMAEIHILRDGKTLVGYSRTGEIHLDSLPFHDYTVHISARDKSIYRRTIALDSDTVISALLQPARANVLLLSIEDDLSADNIEVDLIAQGLTVVRKNYMPALDTTFHYEFVIYSAGGGSEGDVCSDVTGGKLLEYRDNGIKLLIEGGEMAYTFYNNDETEVLDSLLMISGWMGDDPSSSNLILNSEPDSAIELARNPATLPSIVSPRSTGHWDYEYFDIVAPSVSMILYSIGSGSRAGVTYYPDSYGKGLHRISQMFFKYDDALTTPFANEKILRNIAEWLRPPDFDHSVLLARAWVPAGEAGDIQVIGGGDTTTTDAGGRFRLMMSPGDHNIAFSAPHIADTMFAGIELEAGEIRTGDVFTLATAGIDEFEKPNEFSLTRVYPNPFNGRIAFDVSAPEKAEIGLAIFDISGRKVHFEELQIEGRGKFVWDTSLEMDLPSGIYFYKITFPASDYSGKVLLIK